MRNCSKSILIFSALMLSFFLTTCSEDNDLTNDIGQNSTKITMDDVSVTLRINLSGSDLSKTSALSLSQGKDAALVIIESQQPWNAQSDSDWLKMTASSGEQGSTGILVGCSGNISFPRTGHVTIQSGNKSHAITVRQNGAPLITQSVNGVSFNMILVEADTFKMGDDKLYGSTPAHTVSLSSYYICETEVTNRLWNAIMKKLPYDDIAEYEGHTEYSKMDFPLSAATWLQITEEFLPALNSASGLNFRLPTEAEWEFAAMGGAKSKGFDYAGGNDINKVGWNSLNSGGGKHEVKKLQPNELGLYDMSGNVSEWCSDWYSYYYQAEAADNPQGPGTGEEKVLRGGNYSSAAMFDTGECGIRYRSFLVPSGYNGCWGNTGHPDEPVCFFCKPVGFRIVLPL